MCRFVAYSGRAILLSDLLTRSEQSLIHQSYQAREREEPLNGDGFGVGWYAHDIEPTPCVFASITPAWSNRNLHNIAAKIRSSLVFAHVRAASPGMRVSEANCHPFQHGRFLWMHNGHIGQFDEVRRKVRDSLEDQYYNMIEGSTDSEHAFAVFLDILHPRRDDYDLACLEETMIATIQRLCRIGEQVGTTEPSRMNFAVTDGNHIVATRYVTGDGKAETLYLSTGARFVARQEGYDMVTADGAIEAAIIASEPLTGDRDDWRTILPGQMVSLSADLGVRTRSIDG